MDAAVGAGDATPSPGAPAPLAPGAAGAGPTREVFGYLPYWELDNGTDAYLRYDLLTTIAFFGVGYGVDGALITDAPGYRAYMSDRATTIIEHAHAAGVRTVITFQSFDINRNAAFLSDPTAQATFIEQALALMAERGADGANIDIEGLSGVYFDEYGAFVGAFARAAKARNPAAEISVATNANTSGAKMAAAALANGADRAFIMGYNYRSAGSALVGNIAPLVRADGGLSLTRTLELYAAESAPFDRLVLGLPYYGRTWPTVSDALHAARQTDAATYGSASVFFPKNLPGAAEGATATYDAVEHSVVLLRYDDAKQTWVQTYYDDPTSLKPKMQLAIDRGLAGVGIWALGYDRGQPGYWELLAELFRGPQVEAVTVSPSPTRTAAVRVEVAVAPAGSPDAQPVTAVRLSNDRERWGGWTAVGAPVPWTILTAASRRTADRLGTGARRSGANVGVRERRDGARSNRTGRVDAPARLVAVGAALGRDIQRPGPDEGRGLPGALPRRNRRRGRGVEDGVAHRRPADVPHPRARDRARHCAGPRARRRRELGRVGDEGEAVADPPSQRAAQAPDPPSPRAGRTLPAELPRQPSPSDRGLDLPARRAEVAHEVERPDTLVGEALPGAFGRNRAVIAQVVQVREECPQVHAMGTGEGAPVVGDLDVKQATACKQEIAERLTLHVHVVGVGADAYRGVVDGGDPLDRLGERVEHVGFRAVHRLEGDGQAVRRRDLAGHPGDLAVLAGRLVPGETLRQPS